MKKQNNPPPPHLPLFYGYEPVIAIALSISLTLCNLSWPRCSSYLNDSSDVHLGDHLSSVEEHEQRVQRECHILQRRVMLKRLWGVHTHGDDTDDGAGSQQRVHPLLDGNGKRNN